MFDKIMQKFVRFIDPKLERFRPKKPPLKPPVFTPKTLSDFIDVLKRTPKNILNDTGRARIAAIMSFDDRMVKDLMATKDQMIFVNETEILGPLVLDKLYKSGFTDFPVVDRKQKVKGIIHTEALNTLEIKNTDRASKYLDKNVNYLHTHDTLSYTIDEIKRTNTFYFIVLDSTDSLAGFFTIEMLLDYLLGL